ncbi:MAG: hypothetical protein WCA35_06970 [Kovacikia sp.]
MPTYQILLPPVIYQKERHHETVQMPAEDAAPLQKLGVLGAVVGDDDPAPKQFGYQVTNAVANP